MNIVNYIFSLFRSLTPEFLSISSLSSNSCDRSCVAINHVFLSGSSSRYLSKNFRCSYCVTFEFKFVVIVLVFRNKRNFYQIIPELCLFSIQSVRVFQISCSGLRFLALLRMNQIF